MYTLQVTAVTEGQKITEVVGAAVRLEDDVMGMQTRAIRAMSAFPTITFKARLRYLW